MHIIEDIMEKYLPYLSPCEETQQKRESTCRACSVFRVARCAELRKTENLDNSIRPWRKAYTVCPLGLWDPIGEAEFEEIIAKDNEEKQMEPASIAAVVIHTRGRVLELGTGGRKATTAALIKAEHITTIDHQERFYKEALNEYQGNPKVHALYCPLDARGDTYILPDNLGLFDTIIVDGPVGSKTRSMTLPKIIPMMKELGQVLVHDAHRDKDIIDTWAKYFKLKVKVLDTPRGLAILTHE